MPEYRRRLPHLHPNDAYLFLTWRLSGSLPALLKSHQYSTPGHAFLAADRALDHHSTGPHWLIAETILELYAWVIMSNHVHLLILPKAPVPAITRWLKGSTARRANQLLNRTGEPFWQDESYDRWVRNRNEFNRIVSYAHYGTLALLQCRLEWPWWGRRLRLQRVSRPALAYSVPRSIPNNFLFRPAPHRYPPISPSPRTTRWHGIATAAGFAAQARATARAARGSPIR
jgi:hypothetical protein